MPERATAPRDPPSGLRRPPDCARDGAFTQGHEGKGTPIHEAAVARRQAGAGAASSHGTAPVSYTHLTLPTTPYV